MSRLTWYGFFRSAVASSVLTKDAVESVDIARPVRKALSATFRCTYPTKDATSACGPAAAAIFELSRT